MKLKQFIGKYVRVYSLDIFWGSSLFIYFSRYTLGLNTHTNIFHFLPSSLSLHNPPLTLILITSPRYHLPLLVSYLYRIYSEIDREDLAVQMRKRIGDYSRVVYLLRNGTGEELYTWCVCVCMYVCMCVCVCANSGISSTVSRDKLCKWHGSLLLLSL